MENVFKINNRIMIDEKIKREELYNMTTDQLYELYGKLSKLEDRIKAELIMRGNY